MFTLTTNGNVRHTAVALNPKVFTWDGPFCYVMYGHGPLA